MRMNGHDTQADRRNWSAIGFVFGMMLTIGVVFTSLPANWLVPCWILLAVCFDCSWPRPYSLLAGTSFLTATVTPPLFIHDGPTAEVVHQWLPLWLSIVICTGFANRYRSRHDAVSLDASTDDLTGLLTRKAFHARLESRLRGSSDDGQPFSLVFLDCDDFKRRNDEADHRTGDRLLSLIGDAILGGIRDTDFAGRYGGDEFTVLLDGVSEQTAAHVMERLRDAVRASTASEGEPVEVSIGILGIHSFDLPADELIQRTDRLMYQAKSNKGPDPVTARTA